eukprot:m.769003 g.769003  ORF g.769003 m.769003 type:complete len:192 (-) comp23234_c0_seq1:349-924(-)
MNMTDGPGRTYKYLKDPSLALWPFGFGLSYTTFALTEMRVGAGVAALVVASETDSTAARVNVTNTGTRAGDEVVFLYKKSNAAVHAWAAAQTKLRAPPVLPNKELIGFARVRLDPGESTVVQFNVTAGKLSSVDEFGTRSVLPGVHELIVTRGHGVELRENVTVALRPPQARLVISTMEGLHGKTAVDLGL